jgi:hypothetical protein
MWRLVCLLAGLTPALFAQAWVQPRGEGYLSFGYQNWYARNHLQGTGLKADFGHMFTQVLGLSAAYGVTDRLTLTTDLPLVFTLYQPVPGDTGAGPHGLRANSVDDGNWHGTVTDIRMEGRFNASLRPLAVTPFFAASIPTHRYETFGHAVPSRDIREYQVGISVGRQLDPILPRAYFDFRYGYSFAQEVLGISPNRSNADLQLGYFLTQRLSVRGFGSWQKTHAGLELPLPPTDPFFLQHDRLGRTHFMRLGGAFSYSVRRSWDIYAFVAANISGKNTHDPLVVGLGATWSFRTGQKPENLGGALPEQPRVLSTTPAERRGGTQPRTGR